MTSFFQNSESVEQIKKTYRKLVLIHHPDCGGDTESMMLLNAEYFYLLETMDKTSSLGTDGKEHKYSFRADIELEITEFLNKFHALQLDGDIEADLIGLYVWITGNTKPVKDKLKEIGCWWHSTRQCWYFKPSEVKTGRSKGSLEDLANKYGVSNVKFKKQKSLVGVK
jgi:calcineurin-like phosphoesterase family protein